MIINGDINPIINSLIDLDFKSRISVWQKNLKNYKAIYISLHGIRSEGELVKNILTNAQLAGILPAPSIITINPIITSSLPTRLDELLDIFQSSCLIKTYKLVLLVDEMEILEEFDDNGSTIAELFCNRRRYSEIIFIHTGSYKWNETVQSPSSLFNNHLEPYYLGSICLDSLQRYLLANFPQNLKIYISDMSGSKPLYAQYIAKYLSEKGIYNPSPELSKELLKNASLGTQIDQNIFHEVKLDEDSKRILAVLVHHPNINSGWLAEKLKMSKKVTEKKINNLLRFGTISENNGNFRIVGEIIEMYGKVNCDDPAKEDYQQPHSPFWRKVIPYIKWIGMITLIIISFLLYGYFNPGTRIEEFELSNLSFRFEVPVSVESNQAGKFYLSLSNLNPTTKDLTIIFSSSDIRFNNNGESAIRYLVNNDNIPLNYQIDYYVLPGVNRKLETNIVVQGSSAQKFSIDRRPIQLQRYSGWFSALLALLAILIPGKEWGAIIMFTKSLFTEKED